LVEAIMVIVITGIVAGVVATFVARPIAGYLDTVRRAAMTDAADLALKRMAQEIRTALPNSVRVDGSGLALEFIPAAEVGAYLAEPSPTAGNSISLFGSANIPAVASGSAKPQLVIYNTGQSGLNAYVGGNRRDISSAAGSVSAIAYSGAAFPEESPSQRFQIVSALEAGVTGGPVSFVCNLSEGKLYRYVGYGYSASQAVPPSGGARALMMDKVSGCHFSWENALVTNGLASLSLTLTREGESITLQHQLHVSNLP